MIYSLSAAQKVNDGFEEKAGAEIINLFPRAETPPVREFVSKAADSVRSLDDIRLIQRYFLDKGYVRDYALFTVGICTGLRISDLVALKISDVMNEDGSFKRYITIIEKKTGKLSSNIDDLCLITEAMRLAISKYLDSRPGYQMTDPLFYSRKSGRDGTHSLDPKSGWRVLKLAQRELSLPYNVGSHTMRKSFANIAVCVGGDNNINMGRLLSVQNMLKHSDFKTTMRYLRVGAIFTEKARNDVSDFVMGKTDKNNLADALFENSENDRLDKLLNMLNMLIEVSEQED